MKKTTLPLLLAVASALLLPSFSLADTVVEEIIARVNNEIVTRSEYIRSRDQLKQEVQQQDPSNADREFAQKEKDVLRDLIDQQLLLQKGKDLGITGDTELVKRLDEMRKQMNLETMEDLEKAAEAQGASYEEFKQNLRNQIITQKVIGQEVGQKLAMNKEEEKKFYDLHRAEMEQPEQVRLSEILIAPKPQAKPATGADSKPAPPTEPRKRRPRWPPPRPRRRICSTRFTKVRSLRTWQRSIPMVLRPKTAATSVTSSAAR